MHDSSQDTSELPDDRSPTIVRLLTRVERRLARLEDLLKVVATDVDALDRWNRPYGDGARVPWRRRRA